MRCLAAVWFVLAACSANDDVPAPAVAGITPDHASPGASVVLAGSYFCQQPPDGSDTDPLACRTTGAVLFGEQQVIAEQYTDTSITVAVPDAPAGELDVRVTVAGRVSNAVDFTVD